MPCDGGSSTSAFAPSEPRCWIKENAQNKYRCTVEPHRLGSHSHLLRLARRSVAGAVHLSSAGMKAAGWLPVRVLKSGSYFQIMPPVDRPLFLTDQAIACIMVLPGPDCRLGPPESGYAQTNESTNPGTPTVPGNRPKLRWTALRTLYASERRWSTWNESGRLDPS